MSRDWERRLGRLPSRGDAAGVRVFEAVGPRARLLGLAGLRALPSDVALRLPRTRSVHTFGMRFPLDLTWVGADGRVLRTDRGVPPRRLRSCRGARAVIEARSQL